MRLYAKLAATALTLCLAHNASAVVEYLAPVPEVVSCLTYSVDGNKLDKESEAAVRNTMRYLKVVESDIRELAVRVAIPTYLPTPDGFIPPRREAVVTALSRLQSLQTRLMPELLAIAPEHFTSELANGGDYRSRTYGCDAWIRATFEHRPKTCLASSACSTRCDASECSTK